MARGQKFSGDTHSLNPSNFYPLAEKTFEKFLGRFYKS